MTGSNFVSGVNGSTAQFNGTPISTTYVSATTLTAVIPASDLTAAGVDTITVLTGFGGGTSSSVNFTVSNPPATTTTLADNGPNPSTFGEAVTFVATVVGQNSIPDGETVDLIDTSRGNIVVGSGTTVGGSATITTAAIGFGDNDLVAYYVGDFNNAASTSTNPVTQTVSDAPTTGLAVYEPFNYYVPTNSVNPAVTDPNAVSLIGEGPGLGNTSSIGLSGTWTNDSAELIEVVAGTTIPSYNPGSLQYPEGSAPAAATPVGNVEIATFGGGNYQSQILLSTPFGDASDNGTGGSYWVSALIEPQLLDGFSGIQLISGNGSRDAVFLGFNGSNQYVGSIFQGGTSLETPTIDQSASAVIGTTVHLVADVVFIPGEGTTITTYIDPGFGAAPAAGSLLSSYTYSDLGTITALGIASSGRAWNDEIRIGTTYSNLWSDPTLQGASTALATAANDPRYAGVATGAAVIVPAVSTAQYNGALTAANGADRPVAIADSYITTGMSVVLSGGTGVTDSVMVQFDNLASYVPAGYTISDAQVILTGIYPVDSYGAGLYPTAAYNITTSWTDTVANPTPSVDTSAAAAVGTGTLAVGQYDFDITALANGWLDGSIANNGIDIAQTSSTNNSGNSSQQAELGFWDREAGNYVSGTGYYPEDGDRPLLVLTLAPATAPTVTAVSPNTGPPSGGNSVTISGSGFTGATGVDFGTNPATSFIVNSDTSITAVEPAGMGVVDVTVTSSGGTSGTNPVDQFTYVAAPTVTAVNPSTGSAAGGTVVTITGTNFTPTSTVSFGNDAATSVTFVSATSLMATAPAGSAGPINVTVTTASGTSSTSSFDVFTYVAVPTVTGVSPNSSSSPGGTTVTITGTGFTSASTVNFGSTPATNVTFVSATSLTAISPADAVGVVDVTVTTPVSGTSATSPADEFTYTSALVSINATSALVGSPDITISLTGNFNANSTAEFNGMAISTTYCNSRYLTAVIPASDLTVAGPYPITVVTTGPGGGTTSAVTFTVLTATTTSLSSNPVGPITVGTSVDFTATISGSPSVGTVSFYYDYGQTDQIIISSNVAVSGGTATSSSTTALPAGNDLITAIYSGGAGFAGSTGTLLISVTSGSAPPTITSVVINEDISALYNAAGQPAPGTQRSMVNDIVYTFNEAVNIVSPSMEANVFTIAIAAGWTGTLPTLSWAPVAGSGNTEWAVSFSGASVTGGSIANGAYTITVNDPSAITAVSNSEALSLASSGIGSATQSFYRLYGDINGDEFVNASDNLKFKQALTTYNAAFDFNDDGFVNASDNLKFKANLTVNFSGFTPTI